MENREDLAIRVLLNREYFNVSICLSALETLLQKREEKQLACMMNANGEQKAVKHVHTFS